MKNTVSNTSENIQKCSCIGVPRSKRRKHVHGQKNHITISFLQKEMD
uniref:Uncharacterized protein n=1 Tax=Arundo donax TaxID=35708 RepID=A0A0A8ZGF5_ARUDO